MEIKGIILVGKIMRKEQVMKRHDYHAVAFLFIHMRQ